MTDLVFDCVDAQPERYAAVPTLQLKLRISETTGAQVHAIALRCQIRIEPQRRHYSDYCRSYLTQSGDGAHTNFRLCTAKRLFQRWDDGRPEPAQSFTRPNPSKLSR